MRIRFVLALAFMAGSVTAGAVSDPPYVGSWKMNPAKSNFGETTATYEQLTSGEMQATIEGQTYKFRLDGKDYPAPYDTTAAWTSVRPRSWKTVWKLKGTAMWTETLTLSADGKSLTVTVKGTKPNGEPLDSTIVSERVSGGRGLAGKWKTKNLNTSSPSVLAFATSGPDGLTLRIVDMGLVCNTKVDGKDYPCTGPTISEGWTVALTSAGPRALGMAVKNKGTLISKVQYTVSEDGKTLTETGTTTATGEKAAVVYDRQK